MNKFYLKKGYHTKSDYAKARLSELFGVEAEIWYNKNKLNTAYGRMVMTKKMRAYNGKKD